MNDKELSHAHKVAIILRSMDEMNANKLLSSLSTEERMVISQAMQEIQNINTDKKAQIVAEFKNLVTNSIKK